VFVWVGFFFFCFFFFFCVFFFVGRGRLLTFNESRPSQLFVPFMMTRERPPNLLGDGGASVYVFYGSTQVTGLISLLGTYRPSSPPP